MTKQVKIYHNPRCSKSRETLNLLKENGVEPEVVLYLETPADAATLRDLLKILGMNSARELMRQKEDLYSGDGRESEANGTPDCGREWQSADWSSTGAGTGNRGLRCAPSLVEAHCRMRRLPRLIRPTNTMD